MGIIGRQVSPLPITSSNLADDIVSSAKIADDSISEEHLDPTAITGQTEKTSLVNADKFLISDSADSNNLKYVEKQYLPSGSHVKLLGGTASSSVNHDFQNFMDATKYNTYLVNLTEISNGSGGNQRIDLNFIADTTVLNGSHYWGSVLGYRSGDLQAEDAYESQTTGKLGQKLIMNDGNRGNNRFHINVDTSRDFGVNVFGANWGYNSSWGDYMFTNYTIGYNSTATVTGIRFFDSGGNATVFDYEIYGILK
jgi:hypothetical protein